jgi:VanZ family protein
MKEHRGAWFSFNNHPRLLMFICFTIFVVVLLAGFWPFNFFPPNKVKWLSDRNGIQIYGQGIIFSKYPGWQKEKLLFPDQAITIELWLRPQQETGNLPSILTFYDGLRPDIFLIGQWKSHLVIRSRTPDNKARKSGKDYQEIGARNVLLKNQDVFITVTSTKDGTLIFANGQRVKDYPSHRLLGGMTEGNIHLIVGNAPTGQSYWPGEVLGMAVYHRAFSPDEVMDNYLSWLHNDPYSIKKEKSLVGLYLFYEREGKIIHNIVNPDDTLTIPDIFKPVRRVILSFSGRENSKWNLSMLQDIAINIIGFMPVGFFFCMLFLNQTKRGRTTASLLAVAVGIGLSLFVELTQVYLPSRDSSITDLLNNTLGAILGVLIAPRRVKFQSMENRDQGY